MRGLLAKPAGLMSSGEDESEDQPAQNMEEVLKKKREKIAYTKLGIVPGKDDAG